MTGKRIPRTPDDLQTIPGVGPSLAQDLRELGISRVADLRGQDPEQLYARLIAQRGVHQDRCVLYVFRCAVYFAETPHPEPERLKWWHWKDLRPAAPPAGPGAPRPASVLANLVFRPLRMHAPERRLLFRLDVPKKGRTSETCILVYQTADGFSLVATAADDGDAEVFLTRKEFALFRQRLSEVVT